MQFSYPSTPFDSIMCVEKFTDYVDCLPATISDAQLTIFLNTCVLTTSTQVDCVKVEARVVRSLVHVSYDSCVHIFQSQSYRDLSVVLH